MFKFNESNSGNEVHEIPRSHGHGLMDQKRMKGMRNPIVAAVPVVGSGSMPGMNGAGSPGMPTGMYTGDNTGS